MTFPIISLYPEIKIKYDQSFDILGGTFTSLATNNSKLTIEDIENTIKFMKDNAEKISYDEIVGRKRDKNNIESKIIKIDMSNKRKYKFK